MVPQRELQHQKLLEAVQNLNPDVVICDEVSNSQVRCCKGTGTWACCATGTLRRPLPCCAASHECNKQLLRAVTGRRCRARRRYRAHACRSQSGHRLGRAVKKCGGRE
jgi:hypothetical protein